MTVTSSLPETVYLETALRPNASIGIRGQVLLIAFFCSFALGFALFYVKAGAWPVAGFFGLDILALVLAVYFNWRGQAQVTFVRVDETHLRLWHKQWGRADKKLDLPVAFVRVELEPLRRQSNLLKLCYGTESWSLGGFLSPKARKEAAETIRQAVHFARRRA